jgi:hypothetical protein
MILIEIPSKKMYTCIHTYIHTYNLIAGNA